MPARAAWCFIAGQDEAPLTELGWRSLGVLELTALPTIDKERWVGWVRGTDALLVNGGDPLYLAYWLREPGLADLLPSLGETFWAGISAGSMVLTPRIGAFFVGWTPPTGGGDATLGLVDFAMFSHLHYPDFPAHSLPNAERRAADVACPAYAMDDQTAITVVGGTVEVVSEGEWRLFTP